MYRLGVRIMCTDYVYGLGVSLNWTTSGLGVRFNARVRVNTPVRGLCSGQG